MSKVIVFDLWETLGTKNMSVRGVLFDQFNIPNNATTLVRYERAVQLRAWENKEQMARAFLKEFGARCSNENIAFVVATFDRAVRQAVLFPHMASFLRRLQKGGHRLAVVSNTTVFESAVLKKWNMEDWFDLQMFSWETGLLKPDPELFNMLLRVFEVERKDLIFIDDCFANAQAAHDFGFCGIKFNSYVQCRERLGDMRVLPF